MTVSLVRQWHIQLTNPFGTSAGIGLSAADLAGICTRSRIGRGKQLMPWGTPCSRLHAHRVHLHRRIVVVGNFKSP